MKGFSAFLEMRCKDWDHEIISWKHLSKDLFHQFPWSAKCLLFSTLNSLRECWRSTEAAAQDSIFTEADGKCPPCCCCCSVAGKCPWQGPICSRQQIVPLHISKICVCFSQPWWSSVLSSEGEQNMPPQHMSFWYWRGRNFPLPF